jgi:hypothetical protein
MDNVSFSQILYFLGYPKEDLVCQAFDWLIGPWVLTGDNKFTVPGLFPEIT